MAYAALVSLSHTINKILSDQDRYLIYPHEKQRIMSIQERIIFFQDFLEDYAEKASSLEDGIRDAANEAEDIIEYYMLNLIQLRNYTSNSTAGPESSQVSHLTGMFYLFENLEKVTEDIESIAVEVMEIKNSARTEVVQPSDSSSSATLSSRLIIGSTSRQLDIAMVGLGDDLMAIKSRLCGESSKLQVIPIFGMGGIGKTTLAKNAFDDQLIVEHFQIRAWVTVSQDYSAAQILSNLLVSVGADQCSEDSNESKMAENVYKSLKGRRYLIVMDDMWSTKAWDDMRKIFPDDKNSSRIVITTRLSDVAAYPDSSSPLHEMRFMDLDQSWGLLRKKVFPGGNCPPELEDIGKMIARSCRGLPLAIVVIAGLLSTISKTPASWENMARNVNEVVTRNDEQFAEIVLSLSYNHLPHHLRPCFLYMGAFPEDYEIRASKIIKLWVAEGFLKPTESKSCEEVAEECLKDLVKRSLVLVMKRKSNGKIKSCNVHDLVRDLCIRKAQQEKFLVRVAKSRALQKSIRNQRRLSIENSHMSFFENVYGPTIHTIICFGLRPGRRPLISFRKFTLLRVLAMVDLRLRLNLGILFKVSLSLVDPVVELFHLRYLFFNFLTKIPAAISKLENLQTLIIDPRKSLGQYRPPMMYFPSEIWRMRQLRHLVSYTYCCLQDPEGEGDTLTLENLQTLSVANFVCSDKIVKMIPNLKKLGISYLRDRYDQNYNLENLVHLHHLEKLKLQVDKSRFFREKLNPVFPTRLKRLTLSRWGLPWEDMGILIGSLPNLEVLKLRQFACSGAEWETIEGGFLRLKLLLIDESRLQQWTTESGHFPSLERLVLHRCRYLNEIPDGIGEIPTLELIEVDDGNKSHLDSAKRIEEEQQSCGNYALQVRCVSVRAR